MKKLLIAAVVAAISSGALAADLKPYIEGQLGWSNLDDVDTQATSVPVGGGTVTASAKVEFDNEIEFFIHSDPCLPLSCKICEINSCKERNFEFVKKLEWKMENVLPDSKHSFSE